MTRTHELGKTAAMLRHWCDSLGDPLWPGLTESDWAQAVRPLLNELERLVGEASELREALKDIVHFDEPHPMDPADIVDEFQDITRAALWVSPAPRDGVTTVRPVAPREGIVTAYDHDGVYVGCAATALESAE